MRDLSSHWAHSASCWHHVLPHRGLIGAVSVAAGLLLVAPVMAENSIALEFATPLASQADELKDSEPVAFAKFSQQAQVAQVANTQTIVHKALASAGMQTEEEPNGAAASATPIIGRSARIRSNLYPNGDVDYYSFTAEAGDRLYAATMTAGSAGNSTDSQLTVLDTDGSTVIEFDDDNGSFAALSSSIAGAVLPAAGTYYLKVNDFTAGTTSMRGYELYFRLQDGSPTAEVEANDTPATANAVPVNGWLSGARNPAAATEQDWYSMQLNAGDTVFLSLDLDPERDGVVWNGRLGMGLFGDANNQILPADDAGTGDVSPNPNRPSEAMFMTVKEAGTYYAFVDSASAAVGGPTATYQLSVTVFPMVDEGVSCTTYSSTDVPKTIGPGAGLSSSTITVPGNPRIADVNVSIQLNHALMQDVDAVLRSPAGTSVQLFSDIGVAAVGGQTQMDLVFDDEAALPPSFTALKGLQLKPENNSTAGTASTSGGARLSWFDGQNAGGTWTLDLYDDTAGANGGTLTAWSVRICEPEPPPVCPANFTPVTVFSTDFESGASGFTHNGNQDEWELGMPSTLATTTANPIAAFTDCHSGVNCFKTDLDNTYNSNSDQDLWSPSIDLSGLSAPVVVQWAHRHQLETANFDHYYIDAEQVSNPTNKLRLYEWLDPTPITASAGTGNPQVNIGSAIGWGLHSARADALAGSAMQLRFHLDSDTTVVYGGVAIDDVSVTACRPMQSDLAVTQTNGVTTSTPGGLTTYTITASNAGPDAATGVMLTNVFPSACTNTSWSCVSSGGGTCSASGTGNISDSVNLPAGAEVIYSATCTIAANALGTLSSSASISHVSDTSALNNDAVDTDNLTPQADLAITKTDGLTSAVAGSTTTYTITASNAGPSDAAGAIVADTFPAVCNSVTWSCVGSGGGTCTASGAGNINDSVALPAGASVTYTASCAIAPLATGTLANTATVSSITADPNPVNNSATDVNTLVAPGALQLAPASLDFGAQVLGGTSAASAITLSNSGGTPITVTSLAIDPTAPFARSGGSCSALPITIAAGDSCTLDYQFTPVAVGLLSNPLQVDAGSAGMATAVLTGQGVQAVLGFLSTTLDFGAVTPGQSSQQTLTVVNGGGATLHVTSLSAVNSPFSLDSSGTCGTVPFALPAQQSCTLVYAFDAPVSVQSLSSSASSAPASAALSKAVTVYAETVTVDSDVGSAEVSLSASVTTADAVVPVPINQRAMLLFLVLALVSAVWLQRARRR